MVDNGNEPTPVIRQSAKLTEADIPAPVVDTTPVIRQSAKLTEPDIPASVVQPVATPTGLAAQAGLPSSQLTKLPTETNTQFLARTRAAKAEERAAAVVANPLLDKSNKPEAPAGYEYAWIGGTNTGQYQLYKLPPAGGGGGGGGNPVVTGTGSTTATAVGQAILGSDGWYYQPMSDGTSVKLVQGQSQVNPADTSAVNSIADILTQAGLNTLATNAYNQLKAGVPAAQIINDIRNSQDYANRFPGMAALAARGQRITESDYITKEQADIALLKQYNIPAGTFDTTAYLGKLISNNVTAPDLQLRLQAAQDSVNSLDPSVIKYAQDTYGLNAGSLAAWALDPTASLPVIQQQAKAMQIGGAALQAGFNGGLASNGELSTTQAQQLANAGVTQGQAQAGFNTLGQEGQFAQALPGDTTGSVTNQQLINAQFGLNSQDTLAVKKLQQARVNEFNEGGAVASNATGITGLGKGNATA